MNGCAKAHFVGKKLSQIGSFPPNFLQFRVAIDVAKMESSTENVISILFVEN